MNSNSILIKLYKAVESPEVCDEFHVHQKELFVKEFGTDNFSSLDENWKTEQNVFVFVAYDVDSATMIAGFRVHISDDRYALPVEIGIGRKSREIYDIVEDLTKYGCAEICALWMTKKAVIIGLGAIDLLRAAIYLCAKNNIENVVSLVGPTSTKFIEHFGSKIIENIGDNGLLHYPNDNFEFYISNVKISDLLDVVEESERKVLEELLDGHNTVLEKASRRKSINIGYNFDY